MKNFRSEIVLQSVVILIGVTVALPSQRALAQTTETSLAPVLQLAIENSTEANLADAEVKFQEAVRSNAKTLRYTPQFDVFSSEQSYNYDRQYLSGTQSVPNSGVNRIYGATITFDLQKLLGPEMGLANEGLYFSRLQNKITQRNVIRTIKKTYALLKQVENDIGYIEQTLASFSKVESILHRQKGLGVYTDVESNQILVQKNFLISDLATKRTEMDSVYYTFSRLLNLPVDQVKAALAQVKVQTDLAFANKKNLNPETLAQLSDREMLQNLGRDYNIAKFEYDHYQAVPLPQLYVRSSHQNPTMPSSQSSGGYGVTEIGFTINLSGFLTRASQSREIKQKRNKFEVLMNSNIRDYRNSIALTANQLVQFEKQNEILQKLQADAEKAFNKSFTFYSQRRIDTLTLLDLTQKFLLATQRFQFNKLQITYLDADLEYLVGGAKHE